jgi:hypothetical protein
VKTPATPSILELNVSGVIALTKIVDNPLAPEP